MLAMSRILIENLKKSLYVGNLNEMKPEYPIYHLYPSKKGKNDEQQGDVDDLKNLPFYLILLMVNFE
jgi:hypothetical protein